MNKSIGMYAKTVVAVLFAALTVMYGALSGPNGDITDQEWVSIALAAVTAVGVYVTPNSRRSDELPEA